MKRLAKRRTFHRTERTMAVLTLGSRLGFRLGVFLAVLEALAWFGNTTVTGHVLDGIALICTFSVLFLSTVGMRWIMSWMDHFVKKDETLW